MIRPALLAIALMLPPLAGAQVIKCHDPASGKTVYTDQPCKDGEVIVPARTEDEIRRDAEAAAQARQDALQREQLELERERLRAQSRAAEQAAAAARYSPAESEDCRAARAEASFRAASFGATDEQIRTARYNAALACGQPPPPEIVAAEPPVYLPLARPPRPRPGYGHDDARWPQSGGGFGGGFGVPSPPRPAPAAPPVPVRQIAPAAPSHGVSAQAAPPRRSFATQDDPLPVRSPARR